MKVSQFLFLFALVNFILCLIGGVRHDLALGVVGWTIGVTALAGGVIVARIRR